MNCDGNYNINNKINNNCKSTVINHENNRLNETITELNKKIETMEKSYNILNDLYLNNNKKLNDTSIELNNLNNHNKKLNEQNNINLSINNKYYHKYNAIKNELDVLKIENNKINSDYKNIVSENNNLLNNHKLLTDPKSIISKNKINDIINIKKQFLINNIYVKYIKNINNFIDNLLIYYNKWLELFNKNWIGEKNNVLSLSNNRNIQLIEYFGGKIYLDENNIPIKKIIKPIDGWKLIKDKNILYRVISDYMTYYNILPKSIPGFNNFYNKNKNNILFDIISSYLNNTESIHINDFLNSEYIDAKYWSNYLDNFNKSIVCSDNIININNIIKKLNNIKIDILNLSSNIDNTLNKFILTDVNNFMKDWNNILNKIDTINDIIIKENNKYNDTRAKYKIDYLFIQIDYIKYIDKDFIINLLHKSIINDISNNINKYYLTNNSNELKDIINFIENNSVDQNINNISFNDNWLIIKSADEYRYNIYNSDENIDNNIISTIYNNISLNKYNIDNIFTNIIDIL